MPDLLIAPFGVDSNGDAFRPNPTQLKVQKWVDKVRAGKHEGSGLPVLYLQGGVGSGKTRALLAPAVECLLEIPKLRALWGRQDFSDIRVSAMETFFEVFPPDLIAKKNVQEHRYTVRQPKGDTSQLFFRDLKDLGGLGSQEFGIIIVTEAHEISEQAYRTLKMRCRQKESVNMILMEGNPPNEEHWLDRFTTPGNPDFDADIEMWEVSTYENWKNLPDTYRNSLEHMPKTWKDKYLYGKFGFMPAGRPFYDGFSEEFNRKQLAFNPDRPIYRAWDYGYRHPACSFHQIDVKGRWLIIGENMGTDTTIDKYGEYIKTMCKEWFPGATFSEIDYGDPAGHQKSDKSELTSVQILASKGIFVYSKPSTYRERKEIIERKLTTLIDGLPALIVDKSCRIIADGFAGGYHYPERKANQAFNPKMFEVPFRDGYYEHLMNTMEYFAINMFTGAETKEDNSQMTYRVVGDMGDIKFEDDDDESVHSRYTKAQRGAA